MAGPRKPRRKSDGSYELTIPCRVCGSLKCEVNSVSNEFYCWTCTAGGLASVSQGYGFLPFASSKDGPRDALWDAPAARSTSEIPDDLTDNLPVFALQEIRRRRQEPQWLIQRFGVRWSHSRGRLWFPAGSGGVLRSVLTWETPKTITVTPFGEPKGLIGDLLHERGVQDESAVLPERDVPQAQSGVKPLGAPNLDAQVKGGHSPRHALHLVLVEGDWKAAVIPVPWTGRGLQGIVMSESQRFTILSSAPKTITVMLDSGNEQAAQKVVESLLPYRARRIDLPVVGGAGLGPDDFPRSDLVKLLLRKEGEHASEF